MTADLETVLRESLRAAPAPPTNIDAEGVQRRAARGRRRLAAVVATCAVGLAIGLAAALPGQGHRQSSPLNHRLAAIENVIWRDPTTRSTVILHGQTMRLLEGCTSSEYLFTETDGVVRRGRLLPVGATCSGLLERAQFAQGLAHFDAILRGPFTWTRSGGTAILSRPGHGILRLVTNGRPAPEAVGTLWQLERYRVHGGEVDNIGHDRLRIAPGGRVAVGGGCASLTGSAVVGTTSIRFSTRRLAALCPVVGAAGSAVVRALQGTVGYEILGDELILNAGRRGYLVYRAVGR